MLRQFIEWLESGEKTEEELLELCLRRIREREPEVRAWVEVRAQEGSGKGPLRGIPFGAKDVFETAGLATEYGSPLYAGRKGSRDAALVKDLRGRGAVLIGKTQTTAFAYFDPAPTRNPRDGRRTPGGSSSGSAAAVAAGMVPFALGTQTQGSVLRPASYCGIVGFKPTHGLLSLEGVLPFAPALDTAGLFTETAADMRLLWERMGFAVSGTGVARLSAPAALDGLDPEVESGFRAAIRRLDTENVDLPPGFAELQRVVDVINDYEGARTHEQRWREHGARIGLKLAQLVERGLKIPAGEYTAAKGRLGEIKRQMSNVFRQAGVILTPAATGPAPRGLESTGDPRMNRAWTVLGGPAISVPLPVSTGLPLGLQLTAEWGHDAVALGAAVRVEAALGA